MNPPNPIFSQLADDARIERARVALEANGIKVIVTDTPEEAKAKALELIPPGAEVMTMTSKTLEAIGLATVLNESGNYDAIRSKLKQFDMKTQAREMRKLAAAPDWAVGSIHAVTEDGHVMVVSGTGSQLAAYVYTGGQVLWVVGTQKIVKDLTEAKERIDQYTFPLEDARVRDAHGFGSVISKVLIFNKETKPDRITIIFVKANLGF